MRDDGVASGKTGGKAWVRDEQDALEEKTIALVLEKKKIMLLQGRIEGAVG
jgi:hypothetical protein